MYDQVKFDLLDGGVIAKGYIPSVINGTDIFYHRPGFDRVLYAYIDPISTLTTIVNVECLNAKYINTSFVFDENVFDHSFKRKKIVSVDPDCGPFINVGYTLHLGDNRYNIKEIILDEAAAKADKKPLNFKLIVEPI